jgi:hypothetical protein
VEFGIYFEDLKSEAQQRLLDKLDTSPEDEKWDGMPIAVSKRGKHNEVGKAMY